jgi:hypothetical protein
LPSDRKNFKSTRLAWTVADRGRLPIAAAADRVRRRGAANRVPAALAADERFLIEPPQRAARCRGAPPDSMSAENQEKKND